MPARPRITLDMLRSFVAVAEALNLSEAARRLRITRQTLRRNLDDLETLRGTPLLRLEGQRYALTRAGAECLPDARMILGWCDSWNSRSPFAIRRVNGFEHARYVGRDGRRFHSQQHSLGSLASGGLPLIRKGFAAWGQALARLDHPAMSALRPYMVIFRRTGEDWIFAEVGARSAYARWFGLAYARSAMGTPWNTDRAGDAFNRFIAHAYREVHDGGAIRLDHLHVHLPRDGHETQPVSFQRLLAGCVLPDGSQALVMLAAITNRIVIDALGPDPGPPIPDHLLMDDAPDDSDAAPA